MNIIDSIGNSNVGTFENINESKIHNSLHSETSFTIRPVTLFVKLTMDTLVRSMKTRSGFCCCRIWTSRSYMVTYVWGLLIGTKCGDIRPDMAGEFRENWRTISVWDGSFSINSWKTQSL